MRSSYIGAATAVLALALGVPLAFSLVRGRFLGRGMLDRVALAPLIVPTIILSVAVYGLFAKLKLIGEWYGLVVAHTVLALPFVVLVMVAGLRDFDRALEQAAEGLGASRWRDALARHPAAAAAEPDLGRLCSPSSPRSTSSWWRCSWPAPT